MANYYKGNAIYDLIKSTQNFLYTSDNLWILIYGNSDYDPKVILLLSGYSTLDYESTSLSTKESETLIYTQQLSKRSSIPFLYVRFNQDLHVLKEVKTMVSGRFQSINLDQYVNILIGFGIHKNNQRSKKPINSLASNVYHNWQFSCGLDITTSDIDLLHVDSNFNITHAFELKRSFIAIEKWEPYPADYGNFILLSKLFKSCAIEFLILFNQYHKVPFLDDITKVKIYNVKYEKKLSLDYLGLMNISDFFLRFK
jgi:hypothetical protein